MLHGDSESIITQMAQLEVFSSRKSEIFCKYGVAQKIAREILHCEKF